MDREALRKAAASRRNEVNNEQKPNTVKWHCTFCAKDFLTESGFMQHFCRPRERIDELKTPLGQVAYASYSEWMRLQKRSIPPPEVFISSRQYNFFIKFAAWSEKTAIPNPNQFIKLMVETGTQPVLWCRTSTYEMYLEWYDKVYPPEQQFIETLDRLKSLSFDLHCSSKDIFKELGPSELAKLVRRRRLSPWLLVVSTNFLRWAQSLPENDRNLLNEAINFVAYARKLNSRPDLARELKAACEYEDL